MANSKIYANGTMKAANVNGEMVPFSPKTGTECVFDYSTGKSVITTVMDIEDSIKEAASGNGAVKVFNFEPQPSVYENSPNERLFVVMGNDLNIWKFTIKSVYGSSSSGYPSTGYFGAIPFNLYNRTNAQLMVDWGDGTTSTLTNSNYTSSSISSSLHKYTQDNASTIHEITVTSPDFSKTALVSLPSYISNTDSSKTPFRAFRGSLVSIDTPIPKVAGTFVYSYNSSTASMVSNTMQGLMYDCKYLNSLCSGVFDCNPNVTNFSDILSLYSTVASESTFHLPYQLFKYNVNASNFSGAFQGRAFKTIPEDLFKYTKMQLNLENTFNSLNDWKPMENIPTNLLWYNTNIRSLSNLQMQCKKFEIRIGSPNVTAADGFTSIGSGTNAPNLNPSERIVYVKNGSITHNTFNSIAASQQLTVIGV